MTSIVKAGVTVTAEMVIGWDTARTSRTVEHLIIGRAAPDITLRPASPRAGRLTYFFVTLAAAEACEALHADDPAPLTVTDPAIPGGGTLTYVVLGDVRLIAADPDGTRWQVDVDVRVIA